MGLVFFGNIINIPSDVDRLAKDTKCQKSQTPNQSPNATANQLDIFQFAANPN